MSSGGTVQHQEPEARGGLGRIGGGPVGARHPDAPLDRHPEQDAAGQQPQDHPGTFEEEGIFQRVRDGLPSPAVIGADPGKTVDQVIEDRRLLAVHPRTLQVRLEIRQPGMQLARLLQEQFAFGDVGVQCLHLFGDRGLLRGPVFLGRNPFDQFRADGLAHGCQFLFPGVDAPQDARALPAHLPDGLVQPALVAEAGDGKLEFDGVQDLARDVGVECFRAPVLRRRCLPSRQGERQGQEGDPKRQARHFIRPPFPARGASAQAGRQGHHGHYGGCSPAGGGSGACYRVPFSAVARMRE